MESRLIVSVKLSITRLNIALCSSISSINDRYCFAISPLRLISSFGRSLTLGNTYTMISFDFLHCISIFEEEKLKKKINKNVENFQEIFSRKIRWQEAWN